MAENVLNLIINNKITIVELFKWLSQDIKIKTPQIEDFTCSQGEFVSYFLNSIHEKVPNLDKHTETPKKVHTPKSIRKVETPRSELNIKRRPALFSSEDNDVCVTPKSGFNKSLLNDSNCSEEANYNSPISPIYGRLNTSTPKSRMRLNSDKALCLGDFITHRKSSGKKKINLKSEEDLKEKIIRRIKPTNLNQNRFNDFGKSENCFNFKNDEEEVSMDNINEHRAILAQERLKIANNDLIPKVTKIITTLGCKEISPNLKLVTFKIIINKLIDIYVYLLENNLVLNLTSEIYFIVSLVLSKQFDADISLDELIIEDESINLINLFTSIHNIVYFGVKVLEKSIYLLEMLDRHSIKLLCINKRLKMLSPFLLLSLTKIYDDKLEISEQTFEDHKLHVCFILDTDNRDNFPSEGSFHSFKKQRDLFYDVIRIWEQNYSTDNFNFAMLLGGKIRTIINLCTDVINFRHFSRLFKLQLLTTCTNSTNEEVFPEDDLSFLSSIPNISNEKLNLLKNRLVMKSSSSGINSLPVFTGVQEFYRDFIVTASTYNLNVHLKLTFIDEILQLNDSKFGSNEIEEQDKFIDAGTKKSYLLCLKSLRLLAKFLGFIESLPYKQQVMSSEKILALEIKLRLWEQPQFDLKQLLINSIYKQTLVLTIPWLTKYLAMLDHSTLRLPYYKVLYNILFKIFYDLPRNKLLSDMSVMLLRLCLGWLFELPHFPSELYFKWYSENVMKIEPDDDFGNSSFSYSIDLLELVDNKIIYTCCSYLNEFKKLLQYNCTENGTITVKHITPVTAIESPAHINEKRVRLQLEEAFLNAQPASMRKTIEFVSERVASASVKNICNNIVPEHKETSLVALRALILNIAKDQNLTKKRIKLDFYNKCTEFMTQRLKVLRNACSEEVERNINDKILILTTLLLADDELKETKTVCVKIASRVCRDKIQQWINTRINEGVFRKDFDTEITSFMEKGTEIDKKVKSTFSLPSTGKELMHNPEINDAIKIVNEIKELSINCMRNPKLISYDVVTNLLNAATETVLERCDANDSISKLINKLFLDLLILLVSHVTSIPNRRLFMKFIDFWKINDKNNEDLFINIICPRNIQILQFSKEPSKAWTKLSTFISKLIKENLLSSKDFESQCIGVYQQDWDDGDLRLFSSCFQNVVDEYSKGKNCDEFTYLLSYLSQFCSTMDLDTEF